ncbi:short-chain fatty acid transporter [Indiicoccus explosivorum]|uniref:short-chain fatty acid transporter n=1 Tax=Indiicoccus explosivorum TaxID=1917864 RepID=UPI000B43641D|nr:TIGR00366 family protein [Indiicoccus explosivorum]
MVEVKNPEQLKENPIETSVKNNPLARLANFFAQMAEKWLPDAFVFAILLTVIAFIAGVIFTDSGPFDMLLYWGDGFWALLTFTAQIITTFVMSFALALTKPVSRTLESIASKCKTPTSAILLVTFTALGASLISWAFGLVVAGIMAKLVGRKVPDVDYRVLVAAGYSGFIIWEGGLSSSPALFVATAGHVFEGEIGIIPITETLLSTVNIAIVTIIFLTLPFVMRLIHPKNPADRYTIDPALLDEQTEEEPVKNTNYPNDKIEKSRLIPLIGGFLGLSYLVNHFFTNGFVLDLNTVNLMFLTAALLLFSNVRELADGLLKSVSSVGQFVLQYPFYAGIMGMLAASGLAVLLANFFIDISTAKTLPLWTFLSAGLLNIFIPSGGGQWAVQAPIVVPAALEMGVEPAKVVMAVAWGDAWTNMIQPFWAIPLLAIAGLKIRDIMGYTLVALLYSGVVIAACMMLFS